MTDPSSMWAVEISEGVYVMFEFARGVGAGAMVMSESKGLRPECLQSRDIAESALQNLPSAKLVEFEIINRSTSAGIQEVSDALDRMTQWKDDLLQGKTVNCVYCGHRYNPGTPEQAQVLKDHIEQCPDHPLAHMRNELAAQPSVYAVRTREGRYVCRTSVAGLVAYTTTRDIAPESLFYEDAARQQHAQRPGSTLVTFKLWEQVDG